jgi:sec-independent protein translocase protein TatA
MMPGPFELIIILVITILIFGGKRLKSIGGDLGGAIKGFKSAMKDSTAEKIDDSVSLKFEKGDVGDIVQVKEQAKAL